MDQKQDMASLETLDDPIRPTDYQEPYQQRLDGFGRFARAYRSHKVLLIVAVVILLALIGGGTWALVKQQQTADKKAADANATGQQTIVILPGQDQILTINAKLQAKNSVDLQNGLTVEGNTTLQGLTVKGSIVVAQNGSFGGNVTANNITAQNITGTFTGTYTGNGSLIDNLNASNLRTGTLSDARLSPNVTLQGNDFNGSNELVQLTSSGALPAVDGSNLSGVNAAELNGQVASFFTNAGNLSSGTLSDSRLSTNVALLNGANSFSNTNTFTAGATVQGALNGQSAIFSANVSALSFTQNGNVVCDNSGNCAASSGVTGTGTVNTLALFTAGSVIGDSIISQSGTTITVAGTLSATALQGDGSGVTNVNATELNGQTASFYQNATNITSGTLADGRLSANVPLLNASNTFTGATNAFATLTATSILQNGNQVCDTSGNCGAGTTINGAGGAVILQGTANQVGVSTVGNTVTLSTPQDIATTSSPTFGGITLNGTATFANGSTIFDDPSNGLSFTVGGQTFIFPSSGGASQTICTTGISCAAGGGQAVILGPGSAQTNSVNTPSIFTNNTAGNNLIEQQSGGVDKFVVDNGGNVTAASFSGEVLTSNAIGFSVSGGTASRTLTVTANATIDQNLASTASPTFNALTLTTALSVLNGGTGSTTAAGARTNLGAAASGANSDITSLSSVTSVGNAAAGLTVGSTGQALTLQGNGSSVFSAVNGANSTTLSFQAPSANVVYRFANAAAGSYDVCTTAGNCVGAGGGVTTAGGTTNTIPLFTGGTTLGDSILTQSGTTVTVGGTLAANTIAPTASFLLGVTGQNVTLQGASTAITSTSGANTNTLTFATPSGSNHTVTIPNASGTVAVSATGPLAIDAAGNITCASCVTTGGGGGAAAVYSLDTMTGDLLVQGTANQIIVTDNSGLGTITLSTPQDINTSSNPTFANLTLTNGLGVTNGINTDTIIATGTAQAASFNGLILTANATGFSVSGGTAVRTLTLTANATIDQNLSTTSSPIFGGLTLTSALTVANGGTGANTAGGARTNLGAAASGANSDITSITGLTTALAVGQGGTGSNTAGGARTNLGAAASGANSDITSLTGVTSIDNASAALSVGDSGQTLSLQGSSASTFAVTSGGKTTTLNFQTPTANVTYRFPTAAAGTYDVCTTTGNCAGVGGGVTTAGGTTNQIALFTGSQTIGDSIISQSGTTVTVAGTLAATALQGDGSLITNLNASNLASGTVPNGRITGTYSGLTGTGALAAGSIASGFGTISTGNNITTTAALQGNTLNVGSGSFTVNATGAITAATGIISSGGIQFSGLSTVGIVQTDASGNLSTGVVDRNSATLFSNQLSVANGGTGSGTAGGARTNLGAAASGANSDITSITGLTTALAVGQGGTGANTAGGARTNLGAAALGANADITSLTAVTSINNAGSALSVGNTSQTLTLQGGASTSLSATNGANSTTVNFQSPTAAVIYRFPTAAAGTYDICTTTGNCAGVGGGVTTTGGTTNQLALFTGSQTIGDSIISQSGTTVTVAGTLAATALQGDGSLITNLNASNLASGTVPNGRITGTYSGLTGTGALATGSIASGFGAISTGNNITTTAALQGNTLNIGSGSFTVNATGAITAATGIISSGGVQFSGLSAVGIVQTDATGNLSTSTVDRNSATLFTSQLSVANGGTGSGTAGGARTNLGAAASGANSDITSITGLTTALAVGQGGTGANNAGGARTNLGAAASGANADITSLTAVTSIDNASAALSVGDTGQQLVLQGNASTTFTVTDSGKTTTLSFQAPTANVNYRFATTAAGNYDICTTAANCAGVGGGVTTAGGTTGTIALFTGSQTIGDSLLSQASGNIDDSGTLSVTGLATLTGGATLGIVGSSTGVLTLASSHAGGSFLLEADSTQNRATTLTIPADNAHASDIVCLQILNNCAAGGGGAVSGGTTNFVAVFASPTSLTTGVLYDDGTFAGVNTTSANGGTFSVQAASGTVGAVIEGAASQDIADFVASGGGSPVAKIDASGNLTAVGGTFSGGLTSTGGAANLNASSNFATNINTGTSTGAVTIGNSADTTTIGSALVISGDTTDNGNFSITGTKTLTVGTGATTLGGTLGVTGLTTLSGGLTESGAAVNLNVNSNFATNINSGTSTGNVAIGNSANTTTIGGPLTLSGDTTDNGNFSITGTKTLTVGTGATTLGGILGVTGLTTLSGGLNSTGAPVNLNASSNFATNINTGTSTGAINIGNGAAGAIAIQSGSTIALTSTNFSVSAAGVVTLASLGAASNDGAVCYNGTSQLAACTDSFETTSGTDFIKNTTTQQTSANFNIQSVAGQVAAKIQGAAGQDITDFIANGGGTVAKIDVSGNLTAVGGTFTGAVTAVGVNAGAGLLQGALGLTVSGAAASINASSNFATNINTGTSTGAVTIGGGSNTVALNGTNASIDTSGNGSLQGSLAVNNSFGGAATFTVGASGSGTIFKVDSSNSRTSIGDSTGGNCTAGRLCVAQGYGGVGASISNLYNVQNVNPTGASTITSQNIVINDTGTAGDTLQSMKIDFTGGSNPNIVAYNTLISKVPAAGLNAGNFLQLTTGGTDRFIVDNAGNLTANGTGSFGVVGSTNGTLTLASSHASGSFVLSPSTSQANLTTITIPTDASGTDTLCLVTLNNCAGTAATSIGALDGGTANANAATIAANVLYLQSASASFAGVVNTTTQTLAGAKTFSSLLTGSAGLTVTGAAVNLNASSNFATNINTGTSTGAVTIGNASSTTTIGGPLTLSGTTTDNGDFGITGVHTLTVGTGATTLGGTLGVTGLTTLSGGLTSTGAAVNLNASSNFATNINTGTSTGAVNIGNGASALNITGNGAVAGTNLINLQVAGDTNSRFTIGADGKLSFGPGNAATDATISRSGAKTLTVAGNLVVTGGNAATTVFKVVTNNANQTGASITGSNSQTGDLLDFLDSSSNVNAAFSALGNQLTLGNATASGTTQGVLRLTDGTSDGFFGSLQLAGAIGSNQTYSLPTTGGTLCTTTTCATGTSSSYIQNGTTQQTSANFNIQSVAGQVAAKIQGAAGQDIIDFFTSAGGAAIAKIDSAGNLSAVGGTFTGAVTAVGINAGAGLLQGALGLTVTGAAASINASSNFATNINTGTSTGAVTIGNGAAGAIAIQSATTIGLTGTTSVTGTLGVSGLLTASAGLTSTGAAVNLNASSNFATNINTGTSTGAVTIGNGADSTNLNSATINTAANSSLLLGSGSSTAIQALSNSGGTQLFTVDNSSGVDRVTVGSVGGCVGTIGSGKLCLAQTVASGSASVVSQNNTAIVSGTANGATAYASIIYLKDTSGNSNILQGLTIDGANTVAANDTFNGISVTAKASTQAGYLLQLNSTAATPVFTVSNNGTVTGTNSLTAVGVNAGAGLLQGALGLTVSGAAASINASSNFATNINTGTSTGAVSIGNGSAGALTLQSGAASSINTGSATLAITSSKLNVDTSGNTTLGGTLTVQGASATVGVIGTTNGTLTLASSHASGSYTFVPNTSQLNATNLNLPVDANANDTICLLTLANCAASGSGFIVNGTAQQTSANFNIQSVAGQVAAKIQGAASQDIIDFIASGGGTVAKIDVSGNLTAVGGTFTGAVSAVGVNAGAGLLQGTLGLTVSGAAASINASSNFATNINTGTSTGAVTIGNGAAGAIAIQSATTIGLTGTTSVTGTLGASGLLTASAGITSTGAAVNLNASSNFATNINTGTSTGAVTIGNASAATTVGGSLTVQGATTIGVVGTTNASLTLASSHASGSIVLQPSASQLNATTLTIPADVNSTDTICLLTLANCAGAGGGVTASGASTGFLARFTGTNTVSNGTLYDDGSGHLSLGTTTGTQALSIGSSNQLTVTSAGVLATSGSITGVGVNAGAGLLQGALGLTVSGAAASINDNSNFNTTINTGTSTGTITIGNGAAGAISLQSGSTLALTSTNFTVATSGLVTLKGGLGSNGDLTTANASTATSITIKPGTSSSAATGPALTLTAGDDSSAGGTGGTVTINGGSATGSGVRTGGSINIDAGFGGGGGSNGGINIGTSTATGIILGKTAGASTFNGTINIVNTLNAQSILNAGSSGQLQVDASGNLSTSGTLSVTNSSGISIGTVGTTNGKLTLNSSHASGSIVLQPSASQLNATTLTIPADVNSTDTVCLLTLANCVGTGGGATASGSTGFLARFTGTSSLANGTLYDDGSGHLSLGTTTGTAALSVGSANQLTIDSSGNLATSGTINQTFSSGSNSTVNSISATNTSSSGPVTLNGMSINVSGTNTSGANTNVAIAFGGAAAKTNNTFTALSFGTGYNNIIQSQNTNLTGTGTLSLGANSLNSGKLTLNSSSVNGAITLQANASQVSAFNVSFPAISATDTVCLLTAANCVGTGGGATASGSTGFLARFTGTSSLANGTLYDDGSGHLSLGTTTGTAALSVGSANQFQVSSTGAVTLAAGTGISFTAGNGTLVQNFTNNGNSSADQINVVNSSTSGSNTINGINLSITGGTGGTYTQNGINLANVTPVGGNTFNGIKLGTGYDNLITSANFAVTGAGAVTAVGVNAGAGLLQGSLGLTVTGAAASINASSNFATNINTGTSTGAVTIGNGAAGAIAIQSASSINLTAGAASTISTGASTLTVTSANFNVTSGGALSAVGVDAGTGLIQGTGGLTFTGAYSQTSSSASTSTAATFAVTNSAASGIVTRTGVAINLTGTNTSGTSANVGLNFGSVTPKTNTTFTAIIVGTGYDNAISANGFVVNGSGAISTSNTLGVVGAATFGSIGTTNASLVLNSSHASGSVTLAPSASQLNATALTIPADVNSTDTVCLLSLANCAGAGGGVTASGASTGFLARFTGTNTVSNGTLYDDGSGHLSIGTTTGASALNVGSSNQLTVSSAGVLATSGSITGVGVSAGAGLLQGALGLTVSGAAASINNNSNFATNINTGTSTGTVTIGNNSNTSNTVNISAGATGAINFQANTVVAAGVNFSLASGNGAFSQTFLNNTGNAHSVLVTNSGVSGSHTVNGVEIDLTGSGTSGSNTTNAINLANVSGIANNTFNGINIGTGYNNLIQSANFNVTSGGALSLGTVGTTNASLVLNSSHASGSVTIAPSTSQLNATALTIPADVNSTDTVCLLTLANCVGTGGGATASGSTGFLARFTGTSSLANGTLYDDGSGHLSLGTTTGTQALSVGSSNQLTITSAGVLATSGSITGVGLASGSGQITGTGGTSISGNISLAATASNTFVLGNATSTQIKSTCSIGCDLTLQSNGATIYLDTGSQGLAAITAAHTTISSANTAITGTTAGTTVFQVQGPASATKPVAVFQNGATPGSGADLIEGQDSSNNVLFSVSKTGAITTGKIGSTGGSLTVASSHASGSFTLVADSGQLNATTLNLPIDGNSTDTVCLLTLANCSGGGITGTGTTGYLARFSGASAIGIGTVFDDGSGHVSIGTATGSQLFNAGSSNQFTINTSGNVTTSGTLAVNNTTTITSSSSGAFLVQNGSSVALLTADASAMQVVIGTTSNGITLSASGGLAYSGTTRHGKFITLPAEYAGGVLDAQYDTGGAVNCSTTNSGTMTSGLNTGITGYSNTTMNYYNWTTTNASAQCYDVAVVVPIPKDFSAWATAPLALSTFSSNTTNGTIAIQVQDGSSTGVVESSFNYVNATPGSNSTWSTYNTGNFSGTYTAGGTMTIHIRMTSVSSANVRIGTISLNYLSNGY